MAANVPAVPGNLLKLLTAFVHQAFFCIIITLWPNFSG